MSSLRRLLLAVGLPVLALAQTQIELQQSKYVAPGNGAVARSGASKLSDTVSVKDYGAAGNGTTDDLPAINRAFAAVAGTGQRIFFPAGTYSVSNTVIVPNKTTIFGVGRGDALADNTVIKALPSFPAGGTMVQMGTSQPAFAIRIENMTIDGSSIAGTCLANQYAEEQSAGVYLLLANCGGVGLFVSTSGAQNSGPFENLEIYPGGGPSVNANTMCVQVVNVIAFRGIRGLTCNAGTSYASRPNVAMAIDGGGTYSDIHVEHFGTAFSLGSSSNTADGMVLSNGQFGPDVSTGVQITAPAALNNQNVTISGISCENCTTLLADSELGNNITSTSLGLYALGDGTGTQKALVSTSNGVGASLFGPFHESGAASFGPGNTNPSKLGTVNIQDATPTTGSTSIVETAGAGQGTNNLFEWHNNWAQLIAKIDAGGGLTSSAYFSLNGAAAVGNYGFFLNNAVQETWSSTNLWNGTPDLGLARLGPGMLGVTNGTTGSGSLSAQSVQLASTGTQPACNSTTRGTQWFVAGAAGAADHLQVCAKAASNSYGWVSVF